MTMIPSTNAKLHNQRNENVLQAKQPHVMFSMTGVFCRVGLWTMYLERIWYNDCT